MNFYSRILKKILPLLLIGGMALLGGCASVQEVPQKTPWLVHYQAMKTQETWSIEGKLGYRSPGHNGSARIHWQQQGQSYRLRLTGPFGVGATQIQGNEQRAVLTTGKDEFSASSADVLAQRLLGMALPVEQLSDWVKGIPASYPQQYKMHVNDNGQLQQLNQGDWTLRYERYRTLDGQVLPGKIKGRYGDIAFTLIIHRWTFPEAVASGPAFEAIQP